MKLMWFNFKQNIMSILRRERPAFYKQARWAEERMICRDREL